MTEKPAQQQSGDQTAEARWSMWKENFERSYGKDAFVSKGWLARKFWGEAGTPTEAAPEAAQSAMREPEAAARPESPHAAVSDPPVAELETLETIRTELGDCRRCKLCEQRTTIVFGEGNPAAKLMFVGEGPGEQEDLQGRPFVGKAGQLLDKIIEAIGMQRGDVYIANVVKCRPPANRVPEPAEAKACETFLFRQIDFIKPKVIVALGGTALKCLFGEDAKITKMRGSFTEFRGTKLMPTYHPAFLLRNPSAKKDVWDDMKKVVSELEQ